jgi:hypothetical protein
MTVLPSPVYNGAPPGARDHVPDAAAGAREGSSTSTCTTRPARASSSPTIRRSRVTLPAAFDQPPLLNFYPDGNTVWDARGRRRGAGDPDHARHRARLRGPHPGDQRRARQRQRGRRTATSRAAGSSARSSPRTPTATYLGAADYYSEPLYASVVVQLIHENRDERDRLHNELRRVLAPLKRRLPWRDPQISRTKVSSEKQDVPMDEQPFTMYVSMFTVEVWFEMLQAIDVVGPAASSSDRRHASSRTRPSPSTSRREADVAKNKEQLMAEAIASSASTSTSCRGRQGRRATRRCRTRSTPSPASCPSNADTVPRPQPARAAVPFAGLLAAEPQLRSQPSSSRASGGRSSRRRRPPSARNRALDDAPTTHPIDGGLTHASRLPHSGRRSTRSSRAPTRRRRVRPAGRPPADRAVHRGPRRALRRPAERAPAFRDPQALKNRLRSGAAYDCARFAMGARRGPDRVRAARQRHPAGDARPRGRRRHHRDHAHVDRLRRLDEQHQGHRRGEQQHHDQLHRRQRRDLQRGLRLRRGATKQQIIDCDQRQAARLQPEPVRHRRVVRRRRRAVRGPRADAARRGSDGTSAALRRPTGPPA